MRIDDAQPRPRCAAALWYPAVLAYYALLLSDASVSNVIAHAYLPNQDLDVLFGVGGSADIRPTLIDRCDVPTHEGPRSLYAKSR